MEIKRLVRRKNFFVLLAAACILYPFAASLADLYTGMVPYGMDTDILFDSMQDENTYLMGEIKDKDRLQQFFSIKEELPILYIKITGFLSAGESTGVLVVKLLGSSDGKVIQVWETEMSKIGNDACFRFDLDKKECGLSVKDYILELETKDVHAGNAIRVYACKDGICPNGYLKMNGKPQAGGLQFQVGGIREKKSYLLTKFWLRVYAAVALDAGLYFIYMKIKCMGRGRR